MRRTARCSKCSGLMYKTDLRDKLGEGSIDVIVCAICAEILDPVILRNRSRSLAGSRLLSPSPRRWRRSQGARRACA